MSLFSSIIFLVMLLVLVIVHEFGHYIAAKLLKIRVDEFAFGFPPKIFSKKIGETEYILNALPLGGYVKIHGEDGTEENKKDPRSFASKKWWQQTIVLLAGVTMNVLFAYVVFIGLSLGSKVVDSSDPLFARAVNKQLIIVDVTERSPADLAGILPGSQVLKITGKTGSLSKLTSEDMIAFVGKNQEGVSMTYKDTEGKIDTVILAPVFGIIKDKKALGVALSTEGTVRLTLFEGLRAGITEANQMSVNIVLAFKTFFYKLLTGNNVSDQLAGPIGVAKAVHSAERMGISAVFFLAAILSLNLAIFNIVPFPALDGGRLAIVLGEALFRKKLKHSLFIKINTFGFMFLMLVFVLVTGKEILHLFN